LANNGGTVITDTAKLMVSEFTGTVAEIQAAFRAALANNDVVITANASRKKDSNDFMLVVVWYDVA
jgi:molybdenum-dependent DNA-binding transcriptional regulator ModE